MTNITLAIDEETVKKVRKLALERNTSLTSLVRESLRQWAAREDLRSEERVSELRNCFESTPVKVGARDWKREDLYER